MGDRPAVQAHHRPGLLCVRSQPAADALEEFHAWYDEEHAPARTRIAGVRSADRFRRIDGDGPDWLAIYELESLSVLDRPDYRSLRERRSDREREVMARLLVLERSVYSLLSSKGTRPAKPAPYLVANWMTPQEGAIDAFHDWYETEHVPMLLRQPAWLRARRYELVEGDVPRFLALHEVADLSVFQSEAYTRSQATATRARVMASLERRERAVFAHQRRFRIMGQH